MKMTLKKLLIMVLFFISIALIPQDAKAISTNELSELDIALTDDDMKIPYISQYNISGQQLQEDTWNNFFTKYKSILLGLSGVCSLTFIALFILNISKLGQSVGNPQKRSEITIGLLWTGIGAAGFSSATVFMAMAYKSLV